MPDAHLYISAYVGETRIHIRVYIPRGNGARARTCTYVPTYVDIRTYLRTVERHGRTDEQRDRRTDGRQICNALTPVLNEMRCGGGREGGRERDGQRTVGVRREGVESRGGGQWWDAEREGGRPSGRIPTLPILLLTISSKLLFAYKIIPHTS